MKNIAFAVLIGISMRGMSQSKVVNTRNLAWGISQTEYKFNQHYSANLDLQLRYEYTDGDMFQWLIRPGVTYTTTSGWQFVLGCARFQLYPNPNGVVPRPEWRPWQEVARKWKIGAHHILYPKIRFEERYIKGYDDDGLADHFSHFSDRIRIRLDYKYQLGENGAGHFFLFAGDELFFQRYDNGFSNFDQNRSWLGLGYKVNKTVTVQASYLNLYQQRNSSTIDQFHVVRLALQLSFERKPREAVQ